ncbi:hypothetical protein RRG08_031893 [Elysia crispata]|uniref:Uncharacterized protein n=1 Tax=Elysia crispata TaxID=231223 RepID=A0AAE1AJ17_9GAST|nr:hypothetical protein RRG08_031893 [Elysia crispata]
MKVQPQEERDMQKSLECDSPRLKLQLSDQEGQKSKNAQKLQFPLSVLGHPCPSRIRVNTRTPWRHGSRAAEKSEPDSFFRCLKNSTVETVLQPPSYNWATEMEQFSTGINFVVTVYCSSH